jgi:hypothetical protein
MPEHSCAAAGYVIWQARKGARPRRLTAHTHRPCDTVVIRELYEYVQPKPWGSTRIKTKSLYCPIYNAHSREAQQEGNNLFSFSILIPVERVIEIIVLILDFTVPPHQIRRLWRDKDDNSAEICTNGGRGKTVVHRHKHAHARTRMRARACAHADTKSLGNGLGVEIRVVGGVLLN